MPGTPTSPPLRAPLAVIGGSGFLGVHVLRALVEATPAGSRGAVLSLGRDPRELPAGVRGAAVDALRPGELEAALERERPAGVVLVAALARGADCDAYPQLARALNQELPRRVAGWCAQRGARLVHVSTDLVFGRDEPPSGGFSEEQPPGPLTLYGRSKAEGEAAVLAADPAALVVRLPLLYGDSGGRGRGASDALLAAVARGERPRLFGDEWRTPLEVSSAARALVELCLRPDGEPRGILHVAGPQRASRLELGLEVLRAAGHPPQRARELVVASTRAAAGLESSRPRDVSLDSARARALLVTDLPDLHAGLARPAR